MGNQHWWQRDPESEQTLPEEAYPSQVTKHEGELLTIDFQQGEICGVNGVAYDNKIEAIRAVEAAGAAYGIGRDMHIGDTIIGIKGRVGFEAAGALLIINAHKMLEKHTLTKWQQYWKDQLGALRNVFARGSVSGTGDARYGTVFLPARSKMFRGRSRYSCAPIITL